MATLDDTATRQECLTDLMEWLTNQINIWAREYKQHKSPEDRAKLSVYETAMRLLKGYVDSFTKPIETDVDEPVVERARLNSVDTRYNHLVYLMEMWRNASDSIKDRYAVEPRRYLQGDRVTEPYLMLKIVPSGILSKVFDFDKTVEIVEIYQESLPGQGQYPFPSYKDGSVRLLKPVCDEAYKAGVAANKKRLLEGAS